MTYVPGGADLIPRSTYGPMVPEPPPLAPLHQLKEPTPAPEPIPDPGVLSLENGLGSFGGRTFVLPSDVLFEVHKLVVAHIADELRKEAKALEEAIQKPNG